jgi:hypothetical protein
MEPNEEQLIANITKLPSPFDAPPKFEPSRFEQLLAKRNLTPEAAHLNAEVKDIVSGTSCRNSC